MTTQRITSIKVSPSLLETFRKYYVGAFNGFITEDKVIDAILRRTVWSDEMTFGSAFHAIIEEGATKYYNETTGKYHIKAEGMQKELVLDYLEIKEALIHRNKYPSMVHEIPCQLKMYVDGFDVLINMRIDGMNGLDAHEHKTTSKEPKIDQYQDSVQWRCYFLAADPNKVQYNIFQYTEDETTHRLNIQPYEFTFYDYPALESDVKKWISLFITFCRTKGLLANIEYNGR